MKKHIENLPNLAELNQRLDYCTTMLMELDNFYIREDYPHAADCLEKIIAQYQLCLLDMRQLTK